MGGAGRAFDLFLGKIIYKLEPFLPDSIVVREAHFRAHRRIPNFSQLKSFSDRINYRRLHPPTPRFTELTDKLAARDYVRERLGESVLVPVIAAPEDIDSFDFSTLPDQFIMKSNHASGQVKIVTDKHAEDLEALRRIAQDWLQVNYHKVNRERHYIGITPRIYFEELLLDGDKVCADYKVHCFRSLRGNFDCVVQVDSDRFGCHTRDFFTPDWNNIHLEVAYPNSSVKPGKPDLLESLIFTAEMLSREFNYVRVDLYVFESRVFFGELTFTNEAGLAPFRPANVDFEWAVKFDDDRVFYTRHNVNG